MCVLTNKNTLKEGKGCAVTVELLSSLRFILCWISELEFHWGQISKRMYSTWTVEICIKHSILSSFFTISGIQHPTLHWYTLKATSLVNVRRLSKLLPPIQFLFKNLSTSYTQNTSSKYTHRVADPSHSHRRSCNMFTCSGRPNT